MIGPALLEKLPGYFSMPFGARKLIDRLGVPVETQPLQPLDDCSYCVA